MIFKHGMLVQFIKRDFYKHPDRNGLCGSQEPYYGFGWVEDGEIGIVTLVSQHVIHVDFPHHRDWKAHPDSDELAILGSPIEFA